MFKTLSQQALELATLAHAGQKRKITGEDYIVHPCSVANMLRKNLHALHPRMEIQEYERLMAAAYLHDVREDCDPQYTPMIAELDSEVYNLVGWLTKDSNMDYATYILRIVDLDHVGIKMIKLCDLAHNLSTWTEKGSMPDKWRLAQALLLRYEPILKKMDLKYA